jgi:hypothetical protein
MKRAKGDEILSEDLLCSEPALFGSLTCRIDGWMLNPHCLNWAVCLRKEILVQVHTVRDEIESRPGLRVSGPGCTAMAVVIRPVGA